MKMGKPTPIAQSEYDPFVDMLQSKPGLLRTAYHVKEDKALLTLQPEGSRPYYFSCFVLTNDYIDAGKHIDIRTGDMLVDLHADDGRTLIGHLFRKVRELKHATN